MWTTLLHQYCQECAKFYILSRHQTVYSTFTEKKKYKFNADLETSFPQIYVYKYMYRVTVQVQETLETPELYEKAYYFTIV